VKVKNLLVSTTGRIKATSERLSELNTPVKIIILVVGLVALTVLLRLANYVGGAVATHVEGWRVGLQSAWLGNLVATALLVTSVSVVAHIAYRLIGKYNGMQRSPWSKLFSDRFPVEYGSKREAALNIAAAELVIIGLMAAIWAIVGLVELLAKLVAGTCTFLWDNTEMLGFAILGLALAYLLAAFWPHKKEVAAPQGDGQQQTVDGSAAPNAASPAPQPSTTTTVS
jgi:hypothetical protein